MALTGSLGKLKVTPRDLPQSFPILLNNICSLSSTFDRRTFVSILRSLNALSVRWNVLTNDEQIGLAAGIARVSTSKPDLLQLNPLFSILNELETSWEDLFLRIPIVLKYVIFRTFSTITLSLSSSPALPHSSPPLPLLAESNIAESNNINNNNNNNNDNNNIDDNNENNIKDIILKNLQNSDSTVADSLNSILVLQSSLLVTQSSILLLLENMSKMGVTRSQLGDKAILAISETVYSILKSPLFSFPSSPNLSSFSTSISTSKTSTAEVDSFFREFKKLLRFLEFSIKINENNLKFPPKLNSNTKQNNLPVKTKIVKIENIFQDKKEFELKNINEKIISEIYINANEIILNYENNQDNFSELHINEIWMKKINAILIKLC